MVKTLVRGYKQYEDMRWFAGEVLPGNIGKGAKKPGDFVDTPYAKGVCFGLIVWWIIKKAKGEDFWKWLLTPIGPHIPEIKETYRLQKLEQTELNRFQQATKKIT